MLVTNLIETRGRLAVISDPHGNLPALEAIMEHVQRGGEATILCLGDYVGYAPFHREVVEVLRRRGAVMLQGDVDAVAARQGTTRLMAGQLDEELRRLLGDLPIAARISMGEIQIVAFHGQLPEGSPLFDADPRLAAELHTVCTYAAQISTLAPDSLFPGIAGYLSADAYVFGHTHRQAYRRIGGKQFVNVAAAGRPRGDVRTSYALLTVADGELRVEFRKVAYDVGAVVEAIKTHGFPLLFAEELQSPPD